ncbi:2-hydroxyacid dehydrogenase [Anaerostipes hadrus]|uniref:2-hydroxyacid dehydrogenase n=1 Tax=Anaerostipes hadrus TaxID=649756 RepID=UPI001ADDC013|nr:2-hydroxyacid dehydrogenase [Anaerostipes hadrus]MBP0050521.1 2-hydroxyacid dehydrogenase [Anaerostipes hadrus]MBP0054173.1 2-hydroxyacid dehydrogenase [Anaerostipes hadrus]
MKCVAVGDMMIPSVYFKEELEKSQIIDEFTCKSWKEDYSKDEFREVIREIETKGPEAFDPGEEITDLMKKADVIFVHQCPVSKKVINEAKNLKYILSCRGGVENIDMEAVKEKGVKVINCPAHNAYAVAEYTIGMILNELRNITRACMALKSGEWREKYQNSETLTEVRSQTIGIIGFGTIGRLVVERLKGFHPTILVNDPFADEDKIREEGCEPVTKEELLKRSDVVTIHARINAGDPPIIGKEEFGQMKETAYLINTARAVAVDMKELYHALSEHKIMGAAIDVFPTEPVTKDEPLLKLDNITVTNHQGGATVESYVKAPEMVLDMLKQTLE